MIFSSLIFLFAFLPLVLLTALPVGTRYQNWVLLFFSLIFYAWGGVSASVMIIGSIVFNYISGRIIQHYRFRNKSRTVLVYAIAANLLLLVYIKYGNFLVENLSMLLQSAGFSPLDNPGIKLIPGISFFTFHSISYIVDIYRNESDAQKNIFTMGLYIAFFPQLIAGPIIRYHEIADQFAHRERSIRNLSDGIYLFLTGLVKKVIFSNAFAVPADEIFAMKLGQIDTGLAWLGIICYSLHIYCDFSAYSDMAIGLGRMFGFRFPENFNFPYKAHSIQEFWRRWHMTLSRWFRDYLYIPLGGNRKGPFRTYFNLSLVFFLTGLWHGASWCMVIWGFIHGSFLILERLFLKETLDRFRWLGHVYTLMIVMLAWVFFKTGTMPGGGSADFAMDYIGRLFGIGEAIPFQSYFFYLNHEFIFILLFAMLFSSGLPHWLKDQLVQSGKFSILLKVAEPVKYSLMLILFIVCTLYLNVQGYNPFIYYQF